MAVEPVATPFVDALFDEHGPGEGGHGVEGHQQEAERELTPVLAEDGRKAEVARRRLSFSRSMWGKSRTGFRAATRAKSSGVGARLSRHPPPVRRPGPMLAAPTARNELVWRGCGAVTAGTGTSVASSLDAVPHWLCLVLLEPREQ